MSVLPRNLPVSVKGSLLALLLLSFSGRAALAAVLTFVDSYFDGDNGIEDLAGAASVAVSPDGRNVYVASGRASAVATFDRNPTSGRLVFLDALTDGVTAEGIGLASVAAVSPDGRQVYVTGRADSALAVFNRDLASGLLTFFEAHFDGIDDIEGIGGAGAIAVSPEATDVYVAGGTDSAIVAFRRDPSTGSLGLVASYFDGVDGVDGLQTPSGVVVSPDGANVYAVGNRDNAIVTFSRDPDTGNLTFVEALVNGVGVPRGLTRPNAVAVSPDAKQVYVASFDEDITVLDRDESNGRLAFKQNRNVLRGGPNALALSPDGAHLYVTSFIDSMRSELNVFSREPAGGVALMETHVNGVGGPSGLGGASSVAVSPDSRHVYATGASENSLAVLTTAPCPGDCDLDGTVTVGELVTGINIALESLPLDRCSPFDGDGNGIVSIAEALQSVGSGLGGCPSS